MSSRLTLLLAGALLVVAAAGCGGGDDDDEPRRGQASLDRALIAAASACWLPGSTRTP